MNLRKTLFILPNLFTLCSVFCGFFSITLSLGALSDGSSLHDLYQAALAICFGYFFDTFDGRVARLTKTQTALGMQLDSLADVITFGVAPAALIYKWGLAELPYPTGLVISFAFVATAAVRLARFNVLSTGEAAPGKFILGLTVPAASSILVALVIINVRMGGVHAIAQSPIAVLVLTLSYLMVSRIRFRSFKDLRVTRRTVTITAALALASIAVAAKLRASFAFLLLMSAYIALGLAEELLFFKRRARQAATTASADPPAAAPPPTSPAQ